MDKSEGIQPESMKPGTPSENGMPSDMLKAGSPPPLDPKLSLGSRESDDDEDARFLTPGNLVMMAILLAMAGWIAVKFTPIEIWAICKAVIGLSFVIFIHELGHFLAAKWCDVNVTTFSIGFGPAIPGCRFKSGETTYKLAILPLGGYVQMVGQVDGDESSDGSEDDPRSYRAKPVWQRMLIISAGVIMNAILAAIFFIGVYMGPGKEHMSAVASYVDTKGPAFEKGVRTGAAIIQIGRVDRPTFNELMQTVITTDENEEIALVHQRPGHEPETTAVKPRKGPGEDRPTIGVSPPQRLQIVGNREMRDGPTVAGTPAFAAGFEYFDAIIGVTDPHHPDQQKGYDPTLVTLLPEDLRLKDDPHRPSYAQQDYFEFARRLQMLANKEIVVRVRRGDGEQAQTHDLKVAPIHRIDFGAVMQMGPILAIREKSDAAKDGGVRKTRVVNEKEFRGDVIERVTVKDVDGTTLIFEGPTLDPERLPWRLRQWSDRMSAAHKEGDPPAELKVKLKVRRHRLEGGEEFEHPEIELTWDKDWRFDRIVPIGLDAPMPIPELGIAYQITTTVAAVTGPNSPLKKDDVIKNLRYDVQGSKDDHKVEFMKLELKDGQWANVSYEIFQQPFKMKKLVMKIVREKKEQEVEIPIVADETCPLADRGWRLTKDTRRVKANDPWHAVAMGFTDTYNFMVGVYQTVRSMILNRISYKNLGGPITIAYATYRFAGMDYAELIFFLGMISINLAVVNFLPIPVLDGGHMVFLIYEKLRGQPASEGIRTAATIVGLVMIAALMIFVSYLDVMRHFF